MNNKTVDNFASYTVPVTASDVILASDYVIKLGPGPGHLGGKVIFQGPPAALPGTNTPWGEILQGGLKKDSGQAREINIDEVLNA